VLLFWGVAPLIQYSIGVFNWDVYVTEKTALKSNALVILFLISYNLSYKWFLHSDVIDQKDYKTSRFSISNSGVVILILIQILIFLFFTIKANGVMFLRGESSNLVLASSQALQLVIEQVSRAISTLVAFLFFWLFRQDKSAKNTFLFILSLALMVFTNFPLALPRYMAGAFYIGLLFIAKPVYKRRSLPIVVLIFIFLFIYPSLSFVRYITSMSDLEMNVSVLSAFTSGDFDNFSTLNMAVLYVDQNGITFGRQLLGALLFFVPRSMWLAKPIGTGHFLATARSMDWTNLSCPLVAEGFVNFGYLGVILFALLLGFIASKLDFKFYHLKKLSVIHLFYPLCLGLIIFILRGDLMSSWAYTMSFLIAAFLVFLIGKPFIVYQDDENTDKLTIE
jgi:oligosaccharide repeat unit polymerase